MRVGGVGQREALPDVRPDRAVPHGRKDRRHGAPEARGFAEPTGPLGAETAFSASSLAERARDRADRAGFLDFVALEPAPRVFAI